MRLAWTVLLLSSLGGQAWTPAVHRGGNRKRFGRPVVPMVSPDQWGMDPSINAYSSFIQGPAEEDEAPPPAAAVAAAEKEVAQRRLLHARLAMEQKQRQEKTKNLASGASARASIPVMEIEPEGVVLPSEEVRAAASEQVTSTVPPRVKPVVPTNPDEGLMRRLLEARLTMEQKQREEKTKNLASGAGTRAPIPVIKKEPEEAISGKEEEVLAGSIYKMTSTAPPRVKQVVPANPDEGLMRRLLEARLAMESAGRAKQTLSASIPTFREEMEVAVEAEQVSKAAEAMDDAPAFAVRASPKIAKVKPAVPAPPKDGTMRKLLQARLVLDQKTRERRASALAADVPATTLIATLKEDMPMETAEEELATTKASPRVKPQQPVAPKEGTMRKLLQARLAMEQKERDRSRNERAMASLYAPPKEKKDVGSAAAAVSIPQPGPLLENPKPEQVVAASQPSTRKETESEQTVADSPPAAVDALDSNILGAEAIPTRPADDEEVVRETSSEAMVLPDPPSALADEVESKAVPNVAEPEKDAIDVAVTEPQTAKVDSIAPLRVDESVKREPAEGVVVVPTVVDTDEQIDEPTEEFRAPRAEGSVAKRGIEPTPDDATKIAAKLPKIDIPPEAVERAAELAQQAIVAFFKGCAFIAKEGFQLAAQAKDSLDEATVKDMDISYQEAFQKMSTGVQGFVKVCAVLGEGIKEVVVFVAKEAKAANDRRLEQQQREQTQVVAGDLDQSSIAAERPSNDTSIDAGLEELRSQVDNLMASASSAFDDVKAKVALKEMQTLQNNIESSQLSIRHSTEQEETTKEASNLPTGRTQSVDTRDNKKSTLFFLDVKD